MVIVVGVVVKCALTTRNIPKEQRKYSNPNPKKSNDFYGRKELGQWAISGNPNTSHLYNNSNQVIIQNLKVEKKSTVPLKRIIKRNTAYTYIHHNKELHPVNRWV